MMNRGATIGLLGISANLPLDNIISVANAAALPGAGTTVGRIWYYTQDTKSWYFWDGSSWVLILDDADHANLVQVIADLAAHIADGSDAHDASAISFVPAGTIASTDVQSAIAEVATDAATDLTAHINDPTDAHDASAISFTPASGIAATDVQAAIEEAKSDSLAYTDTHINDLTAAHLASAIGSSASGNLTSTDVQSALVELQLDIDTLRMVVVSNSALANAATFTPANNRRQIKQVSATAAGNVLADIAITNAQEGDELILLGTDSTAPIGIVNSTHVVLNGSATLAEDDMLYLIMANSKWREVSRSA